MYGRPERTKCSVFVEREHNTSVFSWDQDVCIFHYEFIVYYILWSWHNKLVLLDWWLCYLIIKEIIVLCNQYFYLYKILNHDHKRIKDIRQDNYAIISWSRENKQCKYSIYTCSLSGLPYMHSHICLFRKKSGLILHYVLIIFSYHHILSKSLLRYCCSQFWSMMMNIKY